MTEPVKLARAGHGAKTGIGSHTRAVQGQTDCWLTPPEIIDALGPFDLDPCAAPGQPWTTAKHHYAPPQDGLQLPWFGRIWLNPPYGQQTGLWLDRLSRHGNGIALVFARTETAMFFEHVWGKVIGALVSGGSPVLLSTRRDQGQGQLRWSVRASGLRRGERPTVASQLAERRVLHGDPKATVENSHSERVP